MFLEQLIETLEQFDPDTKVPYGFHKPHSWRADYSELAFEPCRDTTAGAMLKCAQEADGATYEGWKGGDFTMDGSCLVNLAERGEWGEPLSVPTLLWMLGDDTKNVLTVQLKYIKAVWGSKK